MRYRFLFVHTLILFAVASAFGANFAPTQLRLSAPSILSYRQDGSEGRFPVTVIGTPATVTFAIFTKGRGATVERLHGGYLGWHYVDRIDTCIYISAPYIFGTGQNTVIWNGRNENGRIVPNRDYTYYLWGYDHTSPGVIATHYIEPRRFARACIMIKDFDGRPIVNPIIFDGVPNTGVSTEPARVVRNKWVIGSDPEDRALIETTAYFSSGEAPRLTFHPDDRKYFFTESRKPGALVLRKWEWVPNGNSFLRTDWGLNGEAAYPTEVTVSEPPFCGPVSDGANLLFFPYLWPRGDSGIPSMSTGIAGVDVRDGSLVRKLNLSAWWSGPPDALYTQDNLEFRDGFLFANSPRSCLAQMIDPYTQDDTSLVRWANGFGDGIGDKSQRSDSPTWACFGSQQPPSPTSLSPDANLFSVFPATGLDAASFGVFTPDGTGVGYFTIPGMENGPVQALHVINYDSAFDGIYFGGVNAGGDSAGIRYTAFDSVKGLIAQAGDSFGNVGLLDPYEDDLWPAGSVRFIAWDGDSFQFLNIEFSADGGATWTTIAERVEVTKGYYRWTVPEIHSYRCRIRISDSNNIGYSQTSGFFTITGPTTISEEEESPRAFTVANYPNPFNPSTTISLTLPRAGQVSLAVYDVTGRKVAELARKFYPAGRHSVTWNATDCASGVYFCTLRVGEMVETRKMLLVR
ncbi:MAG: T9SS type A sorting domain-containing protein [Candidatus Latescibacterota bacterium]